MTQADTAEGLSALTCRRRGTQRPVRRRTINSSADGRVLESVVRLGRLLNRGRPTRLAREIPVSRINRKTLVFLVALGLVVYTIRGAGTTEAKWLAVKVLYAFLAVLIVTKVLWAYLRRNPDGEADE